MYRRAIWKHYNANFEGTVEELPDPFAHIDLPNPPKERGHAALAPQEIGPFLRKLEYSDAGACEDRDADAAVDGP